MNTLTIAHSDYGVNPIQVIDLDCNGKKEGTNKKEREISLFSGGRDKTRTCDLTDVNRALKTRCR